MLTRLKVSGFKNLMHVDVRFGPFTCIAGVNGVGKSNLFDAIRFLALLADLPLMDAAAGVRQERQRSPDVRGLFFHRGDEYAPSILFEVEILVPRSAVDDLGKTGEAKATFLQYTLELKYRELAAGRGLLPGELEIAREELTYVPKGESPRHLLFDHSAQWRESVIMAGRRSPLISSYAEDGQTIIKLHQDGNQGRPSLHVAKALPRTVLSRAGGTESPTALCARREMASWRFLQMEPSALRRPSGFSDPPHLGHEGAHLAATLYRLASSPDTLPGLDTAAVYAHVSNRLSELIGDVDTVYVDRDDRRELLTVFLRDRSATDHPALALSDGTLRFLALSVLELDPEVRGVICLEEPENGIHPQRIPAMLRLLQDIAVDAEEPVGPDNPLRQVVVNTHSPAVVAQVPGDSLLVAEIRQDMAGGNPFKRASFACLPGNWRETSTGGAPVVAKGKLLDYLNPILPPNPTPDRQRVVDRSDMQMLLPFSTPVAADSQ